MLYVWTRKDNDQAFKDKDNVKDNTYKDKVWYGIVGFNVPLDTL